MAGSGNNFSGDAPPRRTSIPISRLVDNLYTRAQERKLPAYEFSSGKTRPEPLLPGIYDPTTDPE